MNQSQNTSTISLVHPVCCGIDVHKKSVSACLMFNDAKGRESSIVQEFDTFTDSLMELRDWLLEYECPVVAMESTGVYWQPVHNILEESAQVILVNARDIKNLPGHKTDIADSRWLAGLLRYGLLKGSFIPPQHVREWRALTRLRTKHVQTLNDYKRRTHKLFQSANIKIDSVLTDLFGATGRRLMAFLADPQRKITLQDVDKVAHGRVKKKVPELFRSIEGYFTAEHAFLLQSLLRSVEHHEQEIRTLNDRVNKLMSKYEALLQELDAIPGVNEVIARVILAELGPNLDHFPTAQHLASWVGVCPGNNESAGKRKGGRNPVRGHHLKTILVEAGWGAINKKDSYYKEKFYRLRARRGAKKAILAIAHKILKAVYHIIKFGTPYQELGAEYLKEKTKKASLRRLKQQAAQLGMKLTPIEA